jgi:hypothetical protein
LILPIELFLGGIAVAIAMAIFGFIRQPQIPAMLVFGGMFVLIIAVATESIIMDSFADNTEDNIVYNVQSVSGLLDISAGAAANDLRGEYISSTSSRLFGDEIDCIQVPLRKLGLPTGNLEVGIYDHQLAVDNPLKQSFGTMDASTLPSTVAQFYDFCLAVGDTYTIANQDVIGIRYSAGDAANAVRTYTSLTDQFDGTVTFAVRKADATNVWTSTTAEDLTGKFYLRGEGVNITDDTYEFTELPKTIFALMGSMFMLTGALMVMRNN